MQLTKSQSFKEPIILTKILDDGTLLVVDSKTTIRIFNRETLDIISGFKANINHLRYKTKVVSFSSDGETFVSMTTDCKEAILYNAITKKALAKVDRHHGEVSCVGIDNSNRYMFSCGDDGKIFAIDIKSGKLAFTLPSHVDTINDIVFSPNGNWIATTSYDKKISIFHLTMMTPKHKLRVHKAPVMKAMFIGLNRLVSVDKNNTAIVWNIYSGNVIERLGGVHDDVTQLISAKNGRFLFMGTSLGYVLVYDMNSYKQLSRSYIKVKSAITSLEFDEQNNHLILGCEDGDLLFYNIFQGENHLKTLVKEKKYDFIQSYIDENPLLEYTEIYETVSKIWESTLEKAKHSLQNSDKKTALELFSHFKNIPSKNKIIQRVLEEYKEYDKFKDLVQNNKLALAYSLVNKHTIYKETDLYKSLEQRWKQAYTLAQKYAVDPKGIEKAREILAPYRGISEKTQHIQELFTQGNVYKRFRMAMGKKDFRIVFGLIELHPFLTEFPEYTTLMNYADKLYIKSQELVNGGNTHEALKVLTVLLSFTDFRDEAKELISELETKQKFYNAIEENDMESAYKMLDISDELQETQDGKKLQEQWNDNLETANGFAVKGNVRGIEETLRPYMNISSKHMSIGTVFGWCYMVQLENAIRRKEEQSVIERGIKNYISYFGLQDQILSLYEIFVKKYPQSKLNLELLMKSSLKMWRPSMIVDSILD